MPANLAWAQRAGIFEVRVNQTRTNDQHEPTLAVDPTNPNNLLAASKDWRTGQKQVWHYRSTDGGATWADGYAGLLPPELPNQSDPVLGFDATGAAYLAILGYNQSDTSVGGLFVASTTDLGATWSKATLVSANTHKLFNDKEWLVVDRSGNPRTKGTVYATWTLFTTVNPTRDEAAIVMSRSTDGGRTFSKPLTISREVGQTAVQGSFPVVGPHGELYVLYYDAADGVAEPTAAQTGLYLTRSLDGGQTFSPPTKITAATRPPVNFPSSAFRVFILPTLAVDPVRGYLYATWNDYGAGNADTMVVASTDGGTTWSAPVKANDDGASPADQFFPSASVGADGTLHLLWLDRRDDPANRTYRPYYARSTDSGRTFSRNVALTSYSTDPDVGFEGRLIGDYLGLDVSADGSRVYAAWPDSRGGDQDIYFASFPTAGEMTTPPAAQAPPAATALAAPSPQPLTGFNEASFLQRWERADRPVLTRAAQRPWLWGPASFAAATEPYRQGRTGTRQVLYFDKARMEVNSPSANPDDPSFVTNGLLVVELISGLVQVGDVEFEGPRAPSDAPVAGDPGSPDAITYASLASVASLNGDNRADNRTGQPVTATLDRQGRVGDDPARASGTRFAYYEPTLGHNIPDVFWSYLNSTGPVYNGRFGTYAEGRVLDWVPDVGLPLTEPYWTSVRIGGASTQVLVQAFQRRVLTYVASNPPGWQVEMGNVGRHYFDWRYNNSFGPAR